MKRFQCVCGQTLFFENDACGQCGRLVGYAPDIGAMVALDPEGGQETVYTAADAPERRYRVCRNRIDFGVCNWLVPMTESRGLCIACGLNRTIPNLSRAENHLRWERLEAAKRRLVYTLLNLGLPVVNKLENADQGLAFDFLEDRRSNPEVGEEHVYTGHADGVITINLAEADPLERVRMRENLHEQYRTLVGHMRHEVGHYYWDRLIRDAGWLESFRLRFGDERTDYGAALNTHYQQGPPVNWPQRYISAYATAHPWEDWAETWAHHLHMTDTLETAADFGLIDQALLQAALDARIAEWMRLSVMLNELTRSMGHEDIYPFVFTPAVIDKLRFVHQVIASAGSESPSRPAEAVE